MTREEEAIAVLRREIEPSVYEDEKSIAEALDMAIEALEHEHTDEWCTDCKEYDTEKKCCPRFNRVIRGALKREPSEDGTIEVKVEDATKIGRVLISDDKHRGGLYYPDEDEPQGEWINTAPPNRSDNIICDQCGYNSIARYDYCPNCGADMRSE